MTGRGALAARNSWGHRPRGRVREGEAEGEAEAAARGPGPPRGRRGQGTLHFPRPEGAAHPGPAHHPLVPSPPGDPTHVASPQPCAPSPRHPLPRPHVCERPAPSSPAGNSPPPPLGAPPPLRRVPQPPHLGAPRPRTLGSRRAEPALGPAPRRSHFLVGGGRGLPASAPRGRGRRPGWRRRDSRPRPAIRGGGCEEPRRPEMIRDCPSQLYASGN